MNNTIDLTNAINALESVKQRVRTDYGVINICGCSESEREAVDLHIKQALLPYSQALEILKDKQIEYTNKQNEKKK